MGETGLESSEPASLQPPLDDRLLLKWLEDQSENFQSKIAQEKLEELLAKAAQPRHVSGNACIKLCHFIEQCRSSKSPLLRDIAFSKETGLSLFSFYIEWNEKNQHRSMRQVVELLSSLIDKNPDQQTKSAAKASILGRSLSIFSHQAAQPLVKPAFKALECLLSKRTISTQELINAYKQQHGWETSSIKVSDNTEADIAWDSLLAEVFEWMTLADISPAAGKFLVTVFRELRSICEGGSSASHTASWQRWIREGLRKQPEALENVKNYLFPPLFKLDRPGSLLFLEDLNTQSSVWDINNQEFDTQSLLQLAAIETGKKSGLVEEPSTIRFNQKAQKKTSAIIVLQEEPLSALLAHASDTVRSLAFSVLVSSNSTIRPFTLTALSILQSSMSILYCDSDAKFRNEVLSNTKHMIERLRGATAFLVRENEILCFQLRPEHPLDPQGRQMAQKALEQTIGLLQGHASFVEWYIEFLLGELIPTASYQRHITALKAISLLLRSGILKPSLRSPPVRISDNATTWPYLIEFFNSMSMRLLLDLLMDPFEDVRSNATSVLKLASPEDFSETKQDEELQGEVTSSQAFGCVQDAADAAQNGLTAMPSASREESFSTGRKGKPLGLLRDFVEGAKEWSKRTGRADYADGVARSTSLLFSLLSSNTEQTTFLTQLVEDLEAKLSIAEDDLAKAVHEVPVHGTFAALNFVWESINHKDIFCKDLPEPLADTRRHWDSLQLRIVLACNRIWEVVKDILCNDSPEGHLPQDLEIGDVIDTKDVLSYSFRAVHESSNLLHTILEKIQLRWETLLSPPPSEVFTAIGELTFLQLSSLRHRGAFSTVSLTFSKCCALTQVEPSAASSSSNKLQSWYKGALDCIHKQSSTTRRSAGIPALFTAIMAAHAPSPSFEQAMEELMALARQPVEATEADGSKVYQVHALNSIKEIFKSTALGKRSESYIPQGLELAVRSLQAPKWSIRNSGLILFRSITDRLFGTSESKAITESGWDGRATRLYYDAFPNLPQLLDDLLRSDTNSGGQLTQPALSVVEIIFPALDIIRRAGPPASHRDSIRNSVLSHLGSPVWHVREIAAHTVCTFMLGSEWKNSLLALLDSPTNSANLRHGVLLAAKYILERRFALDPSTAFAGVSDLVPLLQKLSSADAQKYKSPIIINSHIELSVAIAQVLLRYECANDEERAKLDTTKANFCNFADEFNYPWMPKILGWFYPGYPRNYRRTYVQCFPAVARIAVYLTALRRDVQGLSDFVQHIKNYGDDVRVAAFECIPEAWKHGGSLSALLKINSAAIGLSSHLSSHTLRVVAYNNVSELLENLLAPPTECKRIFRDLLGKADLFSKVSFLEQKQGTPGQAEACCKIRLGAWVSVAAFSHYAEGDPDFAEFKQKPFTIWSHWLTHGLGADKDLDIRLACACALRIFYTKSDGKDLKDGQAFIPSLLALYHALNDDDEEVRNIAASTVSSILKQPLTPPAAAKKFAAWLFKEYSSSPCFISNLLFQISGSTAISASGNPQKDPFVPAQTQLSLAFALREDDSLFAQEEQNLFIDDVREINLWTTLLSEIPFQSFSVPRQEFAQGVDQPQRPIMIFEFAAWVADAVDVLNNAMTEDGPLGWTSKPPAFKMAFRVLRCANALLEYDSKLSNWSNLLSYEDELYLKVLFKRVVSGLKTFCLEAKARNIHPRLLQEAQSRSLLNSPIKKVSLIWPNQKGGS